jgi:hypothetical protein
MAPIHLVYGIIEDPGAALAAAPRGGPHIGPMSATLCDGMPALRLNTPGWINWSAETVATLKDTDALLSFCRARLQNRTTIFSLPMRTFMNACLDFAEGEVERRRDELTARLEAAGLPHSLGFPDYRDWVFSSFLPLPNVFIAVAPEAGEESFVRVDALLWDGKAALAVMLEGRSMFTPGTMRSLERLQAAHPTLAIARIGWSPRADAPNRDSLPTAYLSRFLDDVALPFGPYRVLSAPADK